MPASPFPEIDYGRSLLLTDLYQLNMLEAYLAAGTTGTAVFEFFVRRLPARRGFLLAAGLEQVVGFLTEARVDAAELDWLGRSGRFTGRLLDYLAGFRFTGDLDALPEGTPVFADEPLVRVTAPILEAQLVETRLINFLQYQTLVATKAARMVLSAPGKGLVDFGLRRAHSGEAGLLAARAAWLAGFAGTASVPAEQAFGIPLVGTMAHSFVQAFDSEAEAFLAFARARPDQTVFLLDTYDTERAARTVTEIAPRLAAEGIAVRGVRLDSGDLGAHARKVRRILDDAGLTETKIVASGGLDEAELAALTRAGAPIDLFGIGTSLVTSEDLPALDCAYKLKAYAGRARRKRSEGKAYWPGPTQVHRRRDAEGRPIGDLLARADEPAPAGPGWDAPLLRPVLRAGRPVAPLPSLAKARAHAAEQLARLPEPLTRLAEAPPYEVAVTDGLRALAAEVDGFGRQ
ncbi:nicotinate phosphoribosyltransferase [Tistlia consotensis]|uniref:Nicotinate phosphoribosyltransferase n=1 Tax=Tistlia consotensis USBA 355 TaxID=560819 RepID=A0A1Y6B3R4_9PROT|nr:nicotinate phosphoribosyltransferase [Tistlia consotensis]SME89955.1 nicotinate phosphoribosyltransferase [Tistlia consotensis USBA 355]SNR26469.1 nicotinate phosphoribosyltransferase [Tistlia consotensis]